MGDDILEISTENETLKNEKRSYDEKWLENQTQNYCRKTDGKRAGIVTTRIKNGYLNRVDKGIHEL